MKTFFGGILFLKLTAQPVNTAYANIGVSFGTSSFTEITQALTKAYGPPFNRKCIVSYNLLWYFAEAFTMKFLYTSSNNNYYRAIINSLNTRTSFQA